MDLSELLNSPMGQSIVKSVAGRFGMNEREASGAVNMAVPAILAGLNKNAQSSDGAESLNRALESKHDGSLLKNLSGLLQGQTDELEQDGNGILGHVFGSNRPAIEQGISKRTGIDAGKIAPLLATLAPVVMAYLGKEKRQANIGANGLGNLLGGFLGGQQQSSSGGGILGMLSNALDKDGDGNPLDDLLGGFFGGKR